MFPEKDAGQVQQGYVFFYPYKTYGYPPNLEDTHNSLMT